MVTLLAGCATHRVGYVAVEERRVELREVEGRERPLVLLGDAVDLRAMDQHLVEVDGLRTPAGLRVDRFRPLEGPHALPVWYGPVQQWGVQVGVQDLPSGALVWVDDRAAAELLPHLGDRVVVEGYVEGPQRIRVMYWIPVDR